MNDRPEPAARVYLSSPADTTSKEYRVGYEEGFLRGTARGLQMAADIAEAAMKVRNAE